MNITELENELNNELREKYFCFDKLKLFLDLDISYTKVHVQIITREYMTNKEHEYAFTISFTNHLKLDNTDEIIKKSISRIEFLEDDEKTYKALYDKIRLQEQLKEELPVNNTVKKEKKVKL